MQLIHHIALIEIELFVIIVLLLSQMIVSFKR